MTIDCNAMIWTANHFEDGVVYCFEKLDFDSFNSYSVRRFP